jgi:hypothetical protein
MRRLLRIIVILTINCQLSAVISSCTRDAYDKGEGRYSLTRGDFAEANVNSNREVTSIITDDGETLPLKNLYTAQWVSRPDTTYRCMLYYNKVKEADGKTVADVISMGKVPCPRIIPLSVKDQYKDDPVKFESLWKSKSGKYLNLYLQLKTGQTEDTTAIQKIEFFSDKVIIYPDGRRTLSVLLHHDQGGVPEYYSTQAYISIPTTDLDADSVRFYLNTYSGPVIKTLSIQ